MSINNTKLLSYNHGGIEIAADLILGGDVVGIPTETVYGLAANALDGSAVAKIFKAKGRPPDNPLIIHLCDVADIEKYAKNIPKLCYILADKFCPGPFTMILPKRHIIPEIVSGGLDTVAVRIPQNKIALELIKKTGKPLAAPSANISGSPSPTKAAHVLSDMNGKIPAVIDGGDCVLGLESTVVTFISNGGDEGVKILRPGFITADDIANLGIKVYLDESITSPVEDSIVLSPGMKYKHYSPKADVAVVSGDLSNFIKYVYANNDSGVYAMVFDSDMGECEKHSPGIKFFPYGDTPGEQAGRLYSVLRSLDDNKAKRVYVREPPCKGVGLAVYNRLLRAAEFEIINIDF